MPFPIKILFFVDIGLCITYLLLNSFFTPAMEIKGFFDLNGEYNFPSFYSTLQLLGISILLTMYSFRKIRSNPEAVLIFTLPVIFLLMALDETFLIHEILGDHVDTLLPGGNRKGSFLPSTGIWMLVFGIPFIILFSGLIYKLKPYFNDQLPNLKKLVWGMIILLSGAIGLELLNNFAGNKYWIIVITMEEGLEMIGATIMLWASYDFLNFLKINKA